MIKRVYGVSQDKVQAITSPREESAQQSPPHKLEEAWVAPSPALPVKVPDVPSPAALPGSSGLQPHTQQTLDSTSANKAVRPSDSEFRVVSLDGRDTSAPRFSNCKSRILPLPSNRPDLSSSLQSTNERPEVAEQWYGGCCG